MGNVCYSNFLHLYTTYKLRPAGWIFTEFNILKFYENLHTHFSFHVEQEVLVTILHEDLHFWILDCFLPCPTHTQFLTCLIVLLRYGENVWSNRVTEE